MTAVAVELPGSAQGVVVRRAGRSLLTIVIAVVVLGVLWTDRGHRRAVPGLGEQRARAGSAPQAALDVMRVNGGSPFSALVRVRIPAALPQFLASARISIPGAIVGSMLAEWLVGFEGMGGVLSGYKGQGNYRGVWTIVALSVLVSIVLYELMTIVETALLARWGPEAGLAMS